MSEGKGPPLAVTLCVSDVQESTLLPSVRSLTLQLWHAPQSPHCCHDLFLLTLRFETNVFFSCNSSVLQF